VVEFVEDETLFDMKEMRNLYVREFFFGLEFVWTEWRESREMRGKGREEGEQQYAPYTKISHHSPS
jgi:hypothetical protein